MLWGYFMSCSIQCFVWHRRISRKGFWRRGCLLQLCIEDETQSTRELLLLSVSVISAAQSISYETFLTKTNLALVKPCSAWKEYASYSYEIKSDFIYFNTHSYFKWFICASYSKYKNSFCNMSSKRITLLFLKNDFPFPLMLFRLDKLLDNVNK